MSLDVGDSVGADDMLGAPPVSSLMFLLSSNCACWGIAPKKSACNELVSWGAIGVLSMLSAIPRTSGATVLLTAVVRISECVPELF